MFKTCRLSREKESTICRQTSKSSQQEKSPTLVETFGWEIMSLLPAPRCCSSYLISSALKKTRLLHMLCKWKALHWKNVYCYLFLLNRKCLWGPSFESRACQKASKVTLEGFDVLLSSLLAIIDPEEGEASCTGWVLELLSTDCLYWNRSDIWALITLFINVPTPC